MSAALFGLLFFSLFPLIFFCYRYTPLEVSVKRGNFSGIFMYREIFGLIGLAVIILNALSPSDFNGYGNTEEDSVFYISLIVFYALFVFILVSGVMLKVLFKNTYLYVLSAGGFRSLAQNSSVSRSLIKFSLAIAVASIVVNLFGVIFFGARHAFYGALIHGESLLSIRLDNIYMSTMPTVFNSFFAFCYTLLAICLGGLSFKRCRGYFILFSLVVIYLSTFGGAKSPPVQAFIFYIISSACFSGIRFSLRGFIRLLVGGVVVSILIFLVVWIQMGNMSVGEFFKYLINRLGVGQMSGVYEQFNLKIKDLSYILHAVPFAGFFIDYPVFQKDLMLASEFVADPTSTGVKNSLFISEAYAFGGIYFVLISPVVVGVNYAISLFLVFKVINIFVKDALTAFKVSGLFFAPYLSLTGGMSEWVFFKALLMILIFFFLVYLVHIFTKDILEARFLKVGHIR